MDLRIVKPSVEIWKQNNYNEHIAKCARICYKSENGIDEKLIENLKEKGHLSMFRHYTKYWIVPFDKIDKLLIDVQTIFDLFNSPYCRMKFDDKFYYLVANEQFYIEHEDDLKYLDNYSVAEDEFVSHSFTGSRLRRITVKVVTQISTSRELNRVSPNNIAEQSTRYVNFNKKLGSICCPWWLLSDLQENVIELDEEYIKIIEDIRIKKYLNHCHNSFKLYNEFVNDDILKPQDARGILPLDTATECVYTYFIDEWKHIIKLRYYGTTGKPHPNAKIIAGLIKDKINELGYIL